MDHLDMFFNWLGTLLQYAQAHPADATVHVVGYCTIAIAGLKALGLTAAADYLQRLENSLLAMLAAAKTAFVTSMDSQKRALKEKRDAEKANKP